MGALRQPRLTFSPEEYLMLERSSEIRNEYLDGMIYAMAGASPTHEALVINTGAVLFSALADKPCQAYSSNLRVKSPSDRFYGYPDLTVICGELTYQDEQGDVVTNPQVVFEILSPSTERYDRGEKFEHYREIETLMEYVLISQDRPHIELRYRTSGDEWQRTVVTDPDTELFLPSLGCALRMRDIYRRVPLATDAT